MWPHTLNFLIIKRSHAVTAEQAELDYTWTTPGLHLILPLIQSDKDGERRGISLHLMFRVVREEAPATHDKRYVNTDTKSILGYSDHVRKYSKLRLR